MLLEILILQDLPGLSARKLVYPLHTILQAPCHCQPEVFVSGAAAAVSGERGNRTSEEPSHTDEDPVYSVCERERDRVNDGE